MGQRLKRWESPRREGRNDKGKGGSARQRQLKKRQQMLRQKLQDNSNNSDKKVSPFHLRVHVCKTKKITNLIILNIKLI